MGVGYRISVGGTWVNDPRNPSPHNFVVEGFEKIGEFVLLQVSYPGCINYEGKKILVLKDSWLTESKLKWLDSLDPHFTQSSTLVARFEPTERGLAMARHFCVSYQNGMITQKDRT